MKLVLRRLGEVAGMISKRKKGPTGMIGPPDQFLLSGRRGTVRPKKLIT
jgi:hypothetical protein